MVATRDTDQDVVNFVIGKETIDPKKIRIEQWVPILHTVIEALPTRCLRGFKSLEEILKYDGVYGVERRVGSPLPRMWLDGFPKHERTQIRSNAVFLNCASSGGGFPSGKWAHESYPNAPRKSHDKDGGKKEELLPISTGNFLLSRDRKLYYLSVMWRPEVVWDQTSMSSTPAEFWYQADENTLTITGLDDKKFASLLSAPDKRNLPQVMLQYFNLALIETANDIRSQYDGIIEKKQVIAGYLDRLGQIS